MMATKNEITSIDRVGKKCKTQLNWQWRVRKHSNHNESTIKVKSNNPTKSPKQIRTLTWLSEDERVDDHKTNK